MEYIKSNLDYVRKYNCKYVDNNIFNFIYNTPSLHSYFGKIYFLNSSEDGLPHLQNLVYISLSDYLNNSYCLYKII